MKNLRQDKGPRNSVHNSDAEQHLNGLLGLDGVG